MMDGGEGVQAGLNSSAICMEDWKLPARCAIVLVDCAPPGATHRWVLSVTFVDGCCPAPEWSLKAFAGLQKDLLLDAFLPQLPGVDA